jgi:hypothetical protein
MVQWCAKVFQHSSTLFAVYQTYRDLRFIYKIVNLGKLSPPLRHSWHAFWRFSGELCEE